MNGAHSEESGLHTPLHAIAKRGDNYTHLEAAYVLKSLRDLPLIGKAEEKTTNGITPTSSGSDSEKDYLEYLRNSLAVVRSTLATKPPSSYSMTIWSHCVQPCENAAFVSQTEAVDVLTSLNVIGATSLLIALARLGVNDESLLARIVETFKKYPHQLSAHNISNALNSMSKLEFAHQETLDVLCREGRIRKKDFTPQGIATSLNALSHVSIPLAKEEFIGALKEHTRETCGKFTGQTSAIVLGALYRLGAGKADRTVQKVLSLAPRSIPGMDAHSIASIARTLSQYEITDPKLFSRIVKRAIERIHDFPPQGIVFLLRFASDYANVAEVATERSALLNALVLQIMRQVPSYNCVSVTASLQGLAKCGMVSEEAVAHALFTRAMELLEKASEQQPSKFVTDCAIFGGQSLGMLFAGLHDFQYANEKLSIAAVALAKRWLGWYESDTAVHLLWGCR